MRIYIICAIILFCLPAFAQEIEISGDFYHGGVMVLDIKAQEADRAVIMWQSKTVNIIPSCARNMCSAKVLLPLDYDSPGVFSLKVDLYYNSKHFFRHQEKVTVNNKAYDIRKLTVDSQYVQVSQENANRSAKERVLTVEALNYFSSERMWELPFTKPRDTIVTSPFGLKSMFNGESRSRHGGTDFRSAVGDPVLSSSNGTVILAGDFYFAGNSVYIDHGQGVVSMYFHLSEILVETGQTVAAGDLIAKSGATGRITGPHLHFGVAVQGVLIDPDALF